MNHQRKFIATLLAVAIICRHGHGFAIRRRSTSNSDLSDALEVLERQRRRIQEEDFLKSSKFPVRPQPALLGVGDWLEGDIPDESEKLWLQNTLGLSPYDNSYNKESYPSNTAVLEEKPDFENVEPLNEELDSIFGDQDSNTDSDETGFTASDLDIENQQDSDSELKVKKVKETMNPVIPSKAKKEEDTERDKELDNLTKEEFQALMSAVEKLQKHATMAKDKKSTEAAKTPPPADEQPVSQEELEAVFNSETNDNKDNTVNVSAKTTEGTIPDVSIKTPAVPVEDTDKETLSSMEKYWLLNNYLNYDDTRRKRFTKRAPLLQPPDSTPLEKTYMLQNEKLREENEVLQDSVQRLMLVARLEDMENDALTKTLNEATLSQMEGTVSKREFSSLEEAIKIEEALQELKDRNVNPLAVEVLAASATKRGEPLWKKKEKRMDEDDLEQSYPSSPVVKKKRDMPYVDKQGEWYDKPAEDSLQLNNAYLDAQNAVERLARQYASPVSDFNQSPPYTEDEEDDDAVFPDEQSTEIEYYIPAAKRPDNDMASSIQPASPGQCPSVEKLTSNCQFADQYGLPIDEEARELCNRHELCYACGGTKNVRPGECDELYRADASVLCGQDEDCVVEAELFLRTMKLKHRFDSYFQPACDNRCTSSLIGITQ